jgi:hypothetical protein
MAIVTYKCDTCRRNIDVPQNKNGFEVFRNCIITLNCKGKLYYAATYPEYIRGHATSIDNNLTDWMQRLLLYKHTQVVAATVWKVKHGLNNRPDINVYVYDINNNLIKFIPSSIIYIDINTVKIILPLKYTGIIECIAKYNNIDNNIPTTIVDKLFQISNEQHLTFALSRQYINPVLKLTINTANTNTGPINISVPLLNNNSLLPWGDTNNIYFNGKNFIVYTINLPTIIPNIITSTYTISITALSTNNITNSPIINQKGLVWILLSNGNTYNDKILTSVIDVTTLTNQNNTTTKTITSVNNGIIIDMYPPIKII